MPRIARQPLVPPRAAARTWTSYTASALSAPGIDGQSRFAFLAFLCASRILPREEELLLRHHELVHLLGFLPHVIQRHVGVCWIGLVWMDRALCMASSSPFLPHCVVMTGG